MKKATVSENLIKGILFDDLPRLFYFALRKFLGAKIKSDKIELRVSRTKKKEVTGILLEK